MKGRLKVNIKWERILGLIIIAAAVVYFLNRTFFITSTEAFVNADVHSVSSPLFGQLKMEDLRPGRDVNKGGILFEIDNKYIGSVGIFSDYYNLKHRADVIEMELAEEEISMKKYRDDLRRNEDLQEAGAVPEETLREIRHKVDTLNSEIENKKKQLECIKESIQDTSTQLELHKKAVVHSPVNGAIWSVVRKDGEFTQSGDVVLQIIDKDSVWIDAFFDEKEAASLSAGSTVMIVGKPRKEWRGEILFIRQGQFLKDQRDVNDDIARPKQKDEKGLVAVRIRPIWENCFSSKEFYGYGKKMVIKIKKRSLTRGE